MLASAVSLPFCAEAQCRTNRCSGDDGEPTASDSVLDMDWVDAPSKGPLDVTSHGASLHVGTQNVRDRRVQAPFAQTKETRPSVVPLMPIPAKSPSTSATVNTGSPPESEEDSEWETRRELTGSVAKLVSYAASGPGPCEDLVLRGGAGGHVVVKALQPAGTAAKMGVKVGDRLVSIDGSKELLQLPAEQLAASLSPPSVLVFAGFVGSLKAEVRVCDVAPQPEVVWYGFPANDGVQYRLCEERVFGVEGATSLFLAVDNRIATTASSKSADSAYRDGALLELRRREAARLKQFALATSAPPDALSEEGVVARPTTFGCISRKPHGDFKSRLSALGDEIPTPQAKLPTASLYARPLAWQRLHPEDTPEPLSRAVPHVLKSGNVPPSVVQPEECGIEGQSPQLVVQQLRLTAPGPMPNLRKDDMAKLPVMAGDVEDDSFDGMDENATFSA